MRVRYIAEWPCGDVIGIARLDIQTGRVYNIEDVSFEGETIGSAFIVSRDGNNEYEVIDGRISADDLEEFNTIHVV